MKTGDRIKLIQMDNDPRPVPVGTTGTVTNINKVGKDFTQVSVDWDNGSRLMLCLPEDKFEILTVPQGVSK
jgi:hypothetical protein